MPIKVAIMGITGQLGRAIARKIFDDDRYELFSGLVRSDSEFAGADIGSIAGREMIGRHAAIRIEDALEGADVLIDCSTSEATPALCDRLIAFGRLPLITGVTGMGPEQLAALDRAAEHMPVLAARNFSIGMAVVEMLVSMAAEGLPVMRWDAEIEETHHRRKLDAPSGTALILGEAVARARQQILDLVAERGRNGVEQPRRPGAIGFASTRGGAIIGEHRVRFLSDFEEISIGHKAIDRQVYAEGALAAAAWIVRQENGLYGMRNVISG